MSYTSNQIQSMIDSNSGLIFRYAHSNPELVRFVNPVSIIGSNVLTTEPITGKYKKFKLDGIILFKNSQPIDDTKCEGYKNNYDKQSDKQSDERFLYCFKNLDLNNCDCGKCEDCIIHEGYGCGYE